MSTSEQNIVENENSSARVLPCDSIEQNAAETGKTNKTANTNQIATQQTDEGNAGIFNASAPLPVIGKTSTQRPAHAPSTCPVPAVFDYAYFEKFVVDTRQSTARKHFLPELDSTDGSSDTSGDGRSDEEPSRKNGDEPIEISDDEVMPAPVNAEIKQVYPEFIDMLTMAMEETAPHTERNQVDIFDNESGVSRGPTAMNDPGMSSRTRDMMADTQPRIGIDSMGGNVSVLMQSSAKTQANRDMGTMIARPAKMRIEMDHETIEDTHEPDVPTDITTYEPEHDTTENNATGNIVTENNVPEHSVPKNVASANEMPGNTVQDCQTAQEEISDNTEDAFDDLRDHNKVQLEYRLQRKSIRMSRNVQLDQLQWVMNEQDKIRSQKLALKAESDILLNDQKRCREREVILLAREQDATNETLLLAQEWKVI